MVSRCKKNRSRRCKKNLPSLRVDDDFMQDDDYISSKKVDTSTFKTGIPKSVTCLTIEGAGATLTETTGDSYTFDTNDFDDDGCWEHPDEAEEFFSSNDTEDAENMSQASWEEISEVSSVHSFHSKTGMTFLEVAQMAQSKSSKVAEQEIDNWIAVAKARTLEIHNVPLFKVEPAPECTEEMGEMFDSQFIMNGAKGTRGGKEKFMYNREPKKKYRQWRSKNQVDSMVSCGRVPGANNMISDRQGNRILVKA